MKQTSEGDRDSEYGRVVELLELRSTVQGWLDRLESQRGMVSDHVLERVRTDYEGRLRDALDTLASHRRAIQTELGTVTSKLADAKAESSAAHDQLEEGRLRNLIGEVDDSSWTDREAALVAGLDAAREEESRIRGEAERLSDLLKQLDERHAVAIPSFEIYDTNEAPTAPAAAAFLPDPAASMPIIPEPTAAPMIGKDAFLGEIDRVLTSSSPDEAAAEGEDEQETAPKPGLKCSECGYTNDLSAWFCGVCGADVG